MTRRLSRMFMVICIVALVLVGYPVQFVQIPGQTGLEPITTIVLSQDCPYSTVLILLLCSTGGHIVLGRASVHRTGRRGG